MRQRSLLFTLMLCAGLITSAAAQNQPPKRATSLPTRRRLPMR